MNMEFKPSEPIYIQIMGEIKRKIVSGELKAGAKVEPVRDLARTLGVNPSTVQKAFSELEREGLMYTERTSGRYITTSGERIEKLREGSLVRLVADFVGLMRRMGLQPEEIEEMVRESIKKGGAADE
ncbi:MAG: GntR family transcriptional regulator [Clostridiales bacterium]|nr:GntR family transcriptional regulator [Clostridiales bacterium]